MGTLKRILIWSRGGIKGGGDKSVSRTAVAIGKNKIRATVNCMQEGVRKKINSHR